MFKKSHVKIQFLFNITERNHIEDQLFTELKKTFCSTISKKKLN